jgi:hypothetical protein
MLREWVLADLGVRSWGFDVVFLFGFFGFFFFFFFFCVSFLYTPCMLRGAFYAFLIYSAYYLSKKKKEEVAMSILCFVPIWDMSVMLELYFFFY